MEVTLRDLIDAYSFDNLRDVFTECYGDAYVRNVQGYEMMYENLKLLTDYPLNDCVINISKREEDDNEWHHLCGKEGSTDWNMSFVPWGEWLNMSIDSETVLNYDAKEIICHCLFNMTYYGYNEKDIQLMLEKLDNAVTLTEEELNELSKVISTEELDDLELDEEEKDYLKSLLKYEIESSSSDE